MKQTQILHPMNHLMWMLQQKKALTAQKITLPAVQITYQLY
uniref:Alternative protein CCDC160 n=1 Tax=Homo sapiens TaxID=9606 RepID=L0R6E5_HUMAN|nr:alternative protein CCDC160 [Homo sapiens]